MSEHSLRVGFERQRRNLVVISSLAILSIWADMKPPESISLLGTDIEMNNPSALIWGFWVVFCWWLWRYYSYYHDLRGNETRYIISEYVRERVNDLGIGEFLKKEFDARVIIERNSVVCNILNGNTCEYQIEYRAKHSYPNTQSVVHHHTEDKQTPPKAFVLRLHINAYMHAYLRTRMFTEYYVPFGLAFIASILGMLNMPS